MAKLMDADAAVLEKSRSCLNPPENTPENKPAKKRIAVALLSGGLTPSSRRMVAEQGGR